MKTVLICIVLALTSGAAHAFSVPFHWSGGSLSATNAFALADYSPTSGSTATTE